MGSMCAGSRGETSGGTAGRGQALWALLGPLRHHLDVSDSNFICWAGFAHTLIQAHVIAFTPAESLCHEV